MLTDSSDADEGMWLFNNPPSKLLKRKYDFEPSAEWLLHLQRSAVRFNDGGSGSFISADGLVLTNHHVGRGALQKLSNAEHDYANIGFHAKTRAEEIRAVDSELNVLAEHRGCHRAGECRRHAGYDAGQGPRSPPGRDEHDRKGIARRDRPAERRGDALSRRRLSSLSLQALHRRAARVRSRGGDRLLRRRSGQFRVSAVRSRFLLVPRLRRRQAGEDRALSEMGAAGRSRR